MIFTYNYNKDKEAASQLSKYELDRQVKEASDDYFLDNSGSNYYKIQILTEALNKKKV